MVTELGSFIFKKFGEMPLAVRIITYVLVLIVFLYLVLLPRFIYGECFFKDQGGGEIPLRGHIITGCVEGQSIKIKINEDGIWAFPIVSRVPKNLELKFWYEDKSYPVKFKFYQKWIPTHYKVQFDPNRIKPFYLAQDKVEKRFFVKLIAWIQKIVGVQDVFAQSITEVKKSVYQVISQVLDIPESQLLPNKSITEDLNADAIKRIKLVIALEDEFNIEIPDERWEQLFTIQHIIDYIYQRLNNE